MILFRGGLWYFVELLDSATTVSVIHVRENMNSLTGD
jgi:hypothetical protein